jgi:hypothetical protein
MKLLKHDKHRETGVSYGVDYENDTLLRFDVDSRLPFSTFH